ncbi:hypothetical protein [Tsukamurella sp. 1534]|uniref:hypothetical protein n=1 Tax=Tsukamurella sp. 1534 TaxID=1151061 RepID=UPI00059442EE|nr:hypothetical protein [Tsukamurella sp. 1534]
MNALMTRAVSAAVATTAVAAAVFAGPVAADPGRIAVGPISVPRAALAGWEVRGPGPDQIVSAVAQLQDRNWASLIEFGTTEADGRASRDVARAIVLNAPSNKAYKSSKARIEGLAITPTTVSGIPASRATAEVRIDGGPVRADRFRVTVIDTKPQTYFLSLVPDEAPDRRRQADAAEAGAVATR